MKSRHLEIIQKLADPGFDIGTILDQFKILEAKEFTFIVQDSGERHHGNCGLYVFNNKDELVDQGVYWNAIDDKPMPGKFIYKNLPWCRWVDSRKPTMR